MNSRRGRDGSIRQELAAGDTSASTLQVASHAFASEDVTAITNLLFDYPIMFGWGLSNQYFWIVVVQENDAYDRLTIELCAS
jgi:hypothetical protein